MLREAIRTHQRRLGRKPVVARAMRNEPAQGVRIAGVYERLPVHEAAARPAYREFAREVNEQFETLPLRVRFVDHDPYPSSAAMIHDANRGELMIYSGGSTHPMLSVEENLRFRAVHDAYGHAAHGFGFGAHGEESAWNAHRQMFGSEARRVLATETRGQNSWFNFSPKNIDQPRPKRSFAVQKAARMPAEYS